MRGLANGERKEGKVVWEVGGCWCGVNGRVNHC